jgi:hypothetical protein
MPYSATVLRVMVASPADVTEARDAVERALHGWNAANARRMAVMLEPWRWEISAVPTMGGHPQALINAQGVDYADIVVALFGSRLGSPTPDAVSGTAEEIDRALSAGKPVHVFFSTANHPVDVDTAQLEALREFKATLSSRGILGEFGDPRELEHKIWNVIGHDLTRLTELHDATATAPAGAGGAHVDWLVQPQQEREVSRLDNKGRPKYTTRHWVEITNRGDADAVDATVESVGSSNLARVLGNEPTTIHAGQMRRVPLLYTFGGGGDPAVVRIRWTEDGNAHERDFHVG